MTTLERINELQNYLIELYDFDHILANKNELDRIAGDIDYSEINGISFRQIIYIAICLIEDGIKKEELAKSSLEKLDLRNPTIDDVSGQVIDVVYKNYDYFNDLISKRDRLVDIVESSIEIEEYYHL